MQMEALLHIYATEEITKILIKKQVADRKEMVDKNGDTKRKLILVKKLYYAVLARDSW